MSEENTVNTAPAARLKAWAAAAVPLLRKYLTPELGKRAAVCLFMLALLLCECVTCFIGKSDTDSVFNPFIQGMWLYLAIFGASILPGGVATRILLTIFIAVMGAVAAAGGFLHLRFALDMDCDTFFVLAASSTSEVGEFLGRFLTWQLLVILLAALVLCGGMIALVWRTKFVRSCLNTAVALLLVLPFGINCIRYSSSNELDRIYSRSNLPRLATGYFIYRGRFQKLLALEKAPKLPDGIRTLPGGEAVVGVLVIGESANGSHLGVYGYPRDTTPELAKRGNSCLVYDDAISPFANTSAALYYMLTDAHLVCGNSNAAFTMIDVFKAAGWRVALVSNQARWGKHDGPIGVLTAHCDRRVYTREHSAAPFDENVLPEAAAELRRHSGGKLLLIVHLMGSHQEAASRYPRERARFDNVRDACNADMNGDTARELNEYDNSIAYTDHVLGSILGELEKLSCPAFMLYVSDHSDVGSWSGYRRFRAAGSTIPDVYEVPFVLWSNPAYRRAFPEFWARAARNVHAPLQTDRLIWSCLSAARITFAGFPAGEDIFSGGEYRPAAKRMTGNAEYRPSPAKLKLRRIAK